MAEARALYEPVAGWPKLPDDVVLGYTHGIAEDSQGRIFVFNMSRHAVVVLDPSGTYLRSWGEEFSRGAHGMCLSRDRDGREYVFLTDIERHLVAKYTLDGQHVLTLEAPPASGVYPSPESYVPTDVDVAPNGDVYVADGYGQYYIHHYDPEGKWLGCWGGKGSGDGQFREPHGLWIDPRGPEPLLYVADRRNRRFPCFTLDGKLIRTYVGDYMLPCDLVGSGDRWFVPDLNSRVSIADSGFRVIGHIGEGTPHWEDERWPDIPEAEWQNDRFVSPHAMCVDREGNLLVVEWVPGGRITKWRSCRSI